MKQTLIDTMKEDKMLKALAKAQNKSKRIEKYYSGLTPKCKSEVVSIGIKEIWAKIREINTDTDGNVSNLAAYQQQRLAKWMQDKLSVSKKECSLVDCEHYNKLFNRCKFLEEYCPIKKGLECTLGIDYEQCEYGLNQGTCLGCPSRNKNFQDQEE